MLIVRMASSTKWTSSKEEPKQQTPAEKSQETGSKCATCPQDSADDWENIVKFNGEGREIDYLDEDDITIHEQVEQGEWLRLSHKLAFHKQACLIDMKRSIPVSRKTEISVSRQAEEQGKQLNTLEAIPPSRGNRHTQVADGALDGVDVSPAKEKGTGTNTKQIILCGSQLRRCRQLSCEERNSEFETVMKLLKEAPRVDVQKRRNTNKADKHTATSCRAIDSEKASNDLLTSTLLFRCWLFRCW
ncbi:hypothetical protein F5Y19DRAFT_39680 [Xylariaceae sp. FL1651]|nr:hypothetical protein F5Y19DRAFT_39680 [Xylariaceae sp. FL1651]